MESEVEEREVTASVKDKKVSLGDKSIANLIAGGFAGFVNTIVFYPLDVVKTRMQVEESGKTTLISSFQRGGVFRGMGANLMALVPNWAIYWITYEELKLLAGSSSAVIHSGSAVIAGAVTAVATSPLWVVKTRMQIEVPVGGRKEYRTVFQSLSKVVHEEGFLALYKGLFPSLIGLLHVAVQFPLYEDFRKRLSESGMSTTNTVVIASSTSKVAASIVAYPHEVIRSRLQKDRTRIDFKHNEIRQTGITIRQILRNEGVSSFYRGIGPNFLKTVPSTIVTFTSYELAKKYLSGRNTDR